MSIRFDKKYKSWRGPALEEITDESNNREKVGRWYAEN